MKLLVWHISPCRTEAISYKRKLNGNKHSTYSWCTVGITVQYEHIYLFRSANVGYVRLSWVGWVGRDYQNLLLTTHYSVYGCNWRSGFRIVPFIDSIDVPPSEISYRSLVVIAHTEPLQCCCLNISSPWSLEILDLNLVGGNNVLQTLCNNTWVDNKYLYWILPYLRVIFYFK